jgi:hypothetical protein
MNSTPPPNTIFSSPTSPTPPPVVVDVVVPPNPLNPTPSPRGGTGGGGFDGLWSCCVGVAGDGVEEVGVGEEEEEEGGGGRGGSDVADPNRTKLPGFFFGSIFEQEQGRRTIEQLLPRSGRRAREEKGVGKNFIMKKKKIN